MYGMLNRRISPLIKITRSLKNSLVSEPVTQWIYLVDKMKYFSDIFFDSSKALGTVYHEVLFQILYAYEFKVEDLLCFQSHVTNTKKFIDSDKVNELQSY